MYLTLLKVVGGLIILPTLTFAKLSETETTVSGLRFTSCSLERCSVIESQHAEQSWLSNIWALRNVTLKVTNKGTTKHIRTYQGQTAFLDLTENRITLNFKKDKNLMVETVIDLETYQESAFETRIAP